MKETKKQKKDQTNKDLNKEKIGSTREQLGEIEDGESRTSLENDEFAAQNGYTIEDQRKLNKI